MRSLDKVQGRPLHLYPTMAVSRFFGDTKGEVYELDVVSGAPPVRLVSKSAGVRTPIVECRGEGLVLFGGNFAPGPFYTSGIFALDAASDQQRWSWKPPGGGVSNQLAVGPSAVFLGTGYGAQVVALDLADSSASPDSG